MEEKRANTRAQNGFVLTAGSGGIVATMQAALGQPADPAKPLMTIVPPDSLLQAELYVPSRAIGFIQPGTKVRLLYDAFAYQRFGPGAGTIAENIALFDDQIDMARVRACAVASAIDAEIMAFPMQYNSLVGDMGTTLSSGQKQRVLIARALYREPKILVMDEGTAHLDPAKEAEINRMLKTLGITRIVVAHGQAMMRAADRLLELRGGVLRPINLAEPTLVMHRDHGTDDVPHKHSHP